jgi:hypothetical protein
MMHSVKHVSVDAQRMKAIADATPKLRTRLDTSNSCVDGTDASNDLSVSISSISVKVAQGDTIV